MKGQGLRILKTGELRQKLRVEKAPTVQRKLSFLDAFANVSRHLEALCQSFNIAVSTGYQWIRQWNREGYAGLQPSGGQRGRPPRLDEMDLVILKGALAEKECWTLPEIHDLIKDQFGVDYSPEYLPHVLRRLKLHFAKPFIQDYRRPPEAEELLQQGLDAAFNSLKEQGITPEHIAIGCLDETYPHNRGHTMRFWSIKHRPRQVINTTKFKSNTIGFYAIRGHSVHGFLENAKADSIAEFLRQIKSANVEYKAIITVADNFSSHHARAVQQVSGELGLMWVFLPPYSPDLNPIEFIWKSLKRTLSKGFIKDLQELKSKIDQEWDRLSGSLSFAKKWIERFLSNHKIYAELAH